MPCLTNLVGGTTAELLLRLSFGNVSPDGVSWTSEIASAISDKLAAFNVLPRSSDVTTVVKFGSGGTKLGMGGALPAMSDKFPDLNVSLLGPKSDASLPLGNDINTLSPLGNGSNNTCLSVPCSVVVGPTTDAVGRSNASSACNEPNEETSSPNG